MAEAESETVAELPPREAMEFDVVIVGAGPAGLAAAIRLKQLANEAGSELSVVVLEKGSEVGAHILSGAVIDPMGLNQLIPDWKEKGAPIETAVTDDRFYFLTSQGAAAAEHLHAAADEQSRQLHRQPRRAVRWLGEQAAELGVEIYPGFAASEVLYDEKGAVIGVATGDMGVGRDGKPTDNFVRGMELHGKYTLIAEGARGSLTKQLIESSSSAKGAIRRSTASASRSCGSRAREAQAGPGAALVRLAARQPHRRRLVPLSLRRQPRGGRLRAAPQLREPVPLAVRRVPALQDASRHPRRPSRAASASPTARARSPKAAGSRSRS